MKNRFRSNVSTGILLAVLATLIWSGNFVIARGIAQKVTPITLAFCRWCTATILLMPVAFRAYKREWPVIKKNLVYFFFISLTGITLYNTFIYKAAQDTPAIKLALIGTTAAPVFAIILAAIFLGERITLSRVTGLGLCIVGILLLLTQGKLSTLSQLRFSHGDYWILTGALLFAIYVIMVRIKPAGISSVNFLFTIFLFGTIMLLPAFLIDIRSGFSFQPDRNFILIILYLGAGTSVISYLCWNSAIHKLGAGRTSVFGTLIPIFSTIEASLFLNEKITAVHVISGVLVIAGLMLTNLTFSRRTSAKPILNTES
jgi:drug/metabolite transporter (DMT)-like permease